ncbi:MAG TPA: divergent polysaccharide deacetylase family protein [Spirochaetales bacterium]|nr:divergent polysaccharide deacetylase family protein [Spirochaetales bacterium]
MFVSAFMVFAALAIAIVAARAGRERISGQGQPVAEGAAPDAAERPAPADERKPAIKPDRDSRGTLVFVIDDAGHNTGQLDAFLDFPGPLTIAVLPGLQYSAEAAARARDAGKEVILHQPMEAVGGQDPGPAAVTLYMPEDDVRSLIRANLAGIGGAVGMNNHMGSAVTADERLMTIILDEARAAGVYYLDSLTSGESVVHSVASRLNLPCWERAVFLDNSPDRASIVAYINEGLKVAEKRGYAVMIGHVWSAELAQTLSDLYPGLLEQGFSLSTISRIMMDKDDEDTGY